jgi:uncharacterized protein YfdQ (DUF2303 family)
MSIDANMLDAIHDTGGDASVLVETAVAGAEPARLDPAKTYSVVVPAGAELRVLDLENRLDRPSRLRGTVAVATVDSLVAYVKDHHDDEETTLWVHPTSGAVVAVLNDHSVAGPASWGDHRAALTLIQTAQWLRWRELDGVLGDQQTFAEHIEDGASEIVSPDAATMLEIAQSFHAHTSAAFRQANRLQDGAVSLLYDENVEAKAGQRGELQVPAEFVLAVAPFVGEDPYKITARLRYRLSGGNLRIGYKLDRPDEVIRDALEQIAEKLRAEFPRVYLGEPRVARS